MANISGENLPSSSKNPLLNAKRSNGGNGRKSGTMDPNDLPKAEIYDPTVHANYGHTDEIQLWNPAWTLRISKEGEKFLEDAVCLGYQEDQSLAVLYVCNFDLSQARERLPKFRNTCVPNWPERDKLAFEEMLNSKGRNFPSFRGSNGKLPHVSAREVVSYYYYQKMVKKRAQITQAVVGRKALDATRTKLLEQNPSSLSVGAPIPMRSGVVLPCNICFALKKNIHKLVAMNSDESYAVCGECHLHYCRYKKFGVPAPSPTIAGIKSTREVEATNPLVTGPIATSDTRAAQVKAQSVAAYRIHRRQVQELSAARRSAPTAQERDAIMTQIENIVADENEVVILS